MKVYCKTSLDSDTTITKFIKEQTMKNRVLIVISILMLCLVMLFVTACDSVEIDYEEEAEYVAEELLDNEDFLEALQGSDGLGIKSVVINEEGHLVVTFTDDSTVDLGKIEAPLCEHNYGEETLGISATCTSMGYKTQTCSLCGHVKYAFQEATGHTYGEPVSIMQGTNYINIYTCTVCDSTKVEAGSLYSEGLEYSLVDGDAHYRVDGIGSCTDVAIVIPEEHNGKPVTEIGDRAFYESADIVSVSIPKSVARIGEKAFSRCEKLETVQMPDTVELGLDVFRESINVEIDYAHTLTFIEAKSASCSEAGNVAYYYCELCNEFYSDEKGEERLYEVTIAPSHTYADGSCTSCGADQSETSIVSVSTIAPLGKFALGTLDSRIGLPEYINVTTADGLTHSLPITWDMTSYIKNRVGVYTIEGYIQLGTFHMADGLTNRVETTVEIVEHMKGTADIVFVLDISSSMGEEIANVKNNIVAFSQAIEAAGVSTRWSAITYSDYADCPGDVNEQTRTLMNGAETWFTTATEYESAIASISLAYGGDGPEVAVDGLMMADSLEKRPDARVFYILLTDADYKNNNNYGVSDMDQAVTVLDENGVNVSVITDSSYSDLYYNLYNTTGGIYSNINGDFSSELFDALIPIIYSEVIS